MMEFLIPIGVFVVCIAAAAFFVIASKVLLSVGKSMKGFIDDDCASTLTQVNEVMTVTKPVIVSADVALKSANEDLQEAKKVIANVEDVTGKAVSAHCNSDAIDSHRADAPHEHEDAAGFRATGDFVEENQGDEDDEQPNPLVDGVRSVHVEQHIFPSFLRSLSNRLLTITRIERQRYGGNMEIRFVALTFPYGKKTYVIHAHE